MPDTFSLGVPKPELEEARNNKIDALSNKKQILLEPGYTGVDLSGVKDPQERLGQEALYNQLYKDEQTGQQYMMKPVFDKQGNIADWQNIAFDSTFTGSKRPYTENLYMDTTAEGNTKLGIAAKSFQDRYNPDLGRAPGPKGVTIEDGALLDMKMPYNRAVDYEYSVHSNPAMVQDRAAGLLPTPEEKEAFGAGYSEYYGSNNPLVNTDYLNQVKDLPKGTYVPSKPDVEGRQQIDFGSSLIGMMPIAEGLQKQQEIEENRPNALVNIARAGGGGVLDIAEVASKSPEKLYQFLGGDYLEKDSAFAKEFPTYAKVVRGIKDTMFEGGTAIEHFNKEYIDIDKSRREEFINTIKESWDDGNYISGFFNELISNPAGAMEFAASSYGISKALTAQGAGKIPVFMAETTDTIDKAAKEFEKIHGRKPDNGEKALIAALATVATAVDTKASEIVLGKAGGGKFAEGVSNTIDAAIEKLPSNVVSNILLKPVAKVSAKTGGLMAVEGIQEGPLQEGLVQLAAHQDMNALKDPKVLKEIYVNTMIGAASAPGMRGLAVGEATYDAYKEAKAQQKADSAEAHTEAVNQTTQHINDLKQQAEELTKAANEREAEFKAKYSGDAVPTPETLAEYEAAKAEDQKAIDKVVSELNTANQELGKLKEINAEKFKTPTKRVKASKAAEIFANVETTHYVDASDEIKRQDEEAVVQHASTILTSPNVAKEYGLDKMGTLLQDTIDKVNKIRGTKTKAEQDAVAGEVTNNILSKITSSKFTGDAASKAVKQVLATNKDNPYVVKEVEDAYKTKLQNVISNITENRSKDGKRGSQASNFETMAFTEEEAAQLNAVLDSVVELGNENLTQFAEKTREGLQRHQEIYGSQETSGPAEVKKTMKDVAQEVETFGFLLGGQHYKGTAEHARDMELYVTSLAEGVTDQGLLSKQKEVLDKFNTFVNKRTKEKISATKMDEGGRVLRNPGEIKSFAKQQVTENKALLDIVNKVLANEKLSEAIKVQMLADKEHLEEVIAYNESFEKIYTDLDIWEKAQNTDEVDQVKRLIVKENIKQKTEKAKPKEEAKVEAKPKEEKVVEPKLDKELEKTKVEYEAMKRQEEEGPKTIEEAEGQLGELAQKEEVTKEVITEAVTRVEKIEGMIQDHLDELDRLKSQKKVLQDEINETRVKVKKEHTRIKDAKNKLKEAERLAGDGVISKAVRMLFKIGIEQAKRSLAAYKGVLTRAKNRLAKHKKAIDEYKEELFDLNARIRKAYKAVEVLKEAQADNGMINEVDGLVKKRKGFNLAQLMNELKDSKVSLGNAVDHVFNFMPRIIKESANGKTMLREALKAFNTFEMQRSQGGFVLQKTEGGEKNPLLLEVNGAKIADIFDNKRPAEEKAKVKRAMNIATTITMNEMLSIGMMSSQEIEDVVTEGFAALDIKVDSAGIEVIANKIKSGEMVPLAMFRQNAGRQLMKQLGMRLDNSKLTIQQVQDITTAMGELVINNIMVDTYYAETGQKSLLKKEQGKKSVALKATTAVRRKVIVRDKVEGIIMRDPQQGIEDDGYAAIKAYDLSELSDEHKKEIANMAKVFEYAAEEDHGLVRLEPRTYEYGMKTRNSDVALSNEAVDYLNRMNNMPLKFNKDFIEGYKKLVEKEGQEKAVQQLIESLLGTEAEVREYTHPIELDSALAKYKAQRLEVERMLMAAELVEDKEFYVDWSYTVSNRNMIANKMLNPQGSKISRFLTGYEGMTYTLKRDKNGNFKKDDIQQIKVAIAQALELGIDKTTDEKGLVKLDKFVTFTEDGQAVVPEDSPIKKAVDSGKLLTLRKNLQDLVKEGEVTSDNIGHVYQAIKLIKAMQEKGADNIETDLALEMDGVTNGMAITLMQMGWNKFTEKFLGRAGVYAGNSKIRSHGQHKAEGGLDIYESPIKSFTDALSKNKELVGEGKIDGGKIEFADGTEISVTPEVDGKQVIDKDGNKYFEKDGKIYRVKPNVIEEVVGEGKWRSFMKPLVMVFIYGASIKSIRQKASYELVIKAIKMDKTGRYSELKRLGEIIPKDDREKFYNSVGRLKGLPRENTIQYYARLIEKGIGEKLEKAFYDTFGEVNDFRKSLKIVEEMNYMIFRQELKKKLVENGAKNGLIGEVTEGTLAKIKEEMIKEGTYYSAENAIGGEQDYFKTDVAAGTEADTITVTINPGRFQSQTGYNREFNQMIKDVVANVGAVGVTTVHSIDGAVMSKGHINKVLNIYDALVMGVNSTENKVQAKALNEAFFTLNTEHSIMGKAVQKLVKNLDKLPEEADSLGDVAKIVGDIARIYDISDSDIDIVETLKGIKASTLNNLDEVDRSRGNLKGQEILANQYYVSESMPGFKAKSDKVEGVYRAEEDKAKIAEAFDKLIKYMTPKKVDSISDEVKASIKENDATIKDKIVNKLEEC